MTHIGKTGFPNDPPKCDRCGESQWDEDDTMAEIVDKNKKLLFIHGSCWEEGDEIA